MQKVFALVGEASNIMSFPLQRKAKSPGAKGGESLCENHFLLWFVLYPLESERDSESR